ncbi:class I SAM-dependent methyltransferase [Mucilaginibacter mali]|uniref:Class I SAM-dependent methyltransferase n=1 Tax=Mucilaginibacter mali TaxID=2740462 RepID=A0A7D4UJS3_9SPHI|nr:class I SAM-dependent methyltransferase [Mucilaginibacter mali]QKJ29542.1 class I SAM-dependent methyltransferase [Mucilaginibacter mali]
MSLNLCPACNGALKPKYKLKFDIFKCRECGLYISDASFDHSFVSDMDNDMRAVGLEKLRITNFKFIADKIKQVFGTGIKNVKGLEIGCGNGWWLKTCREEGINCSGIEPERAFSPIYEANEYDVAYGFYPATKSDTQYDFIIMNDVFEHIPDVDSLTASLNADLKDGGYLIINIPMSDGFFSVTARLLNKLGVKSILNRMWQFDFHSPHYTYFNAANLNLLVSKHGFVKVNDFRLNTLDLGSTKERIVTDKKFNKLSADIMAGVLTLAMPVINAAKPDAKVFFFKKVATNNNAAGNRE